VVGAHAGDLGILRDNHVAHLGIPQSAGDLVPRRGAISARICWAIRYSLGCGQRLGLCDVGQ